MPPLKVLLVEDDASTRRLLSRLMRSAYAPRKVTVTEAENLAGAVVALAQDSFDVVLLDLGLPDSSGFHTFDAVRQADRDVPVVVVTGSDDDELERNLLRAGAQDYVVKGRIDEASLRRLIDHSVERESMRRELDLMREQVRQREVAFETQYRRAPIPIFTWRRSGDDLVLNDVNDAAIEMTAGTVRGQLGRTSAEMFGADSVISTAMHEALRGRGVITRELEYSFELVDKQTSLLLTFAFVPPDLVIVYALDVGPQRAATEALRISEERFRTQFEHSPIAQFVWRAVDQDFEYTGCNAAADAFAGGRAAEWLGAKASEVYRNYPSLRQAMHSSYSSRTAIRLAIDYDWRERGIRHLEITIGFAEPDTLILHVQDITTVAEAQKALAESERNYRILFEEAPAGILILSPSERIVDANVQASLLLGQSEEALLDRRLTDVIDHGRDIAHPERGGPVTSERIVRWPSGVEVPVEVSSAMLADGRVLVLIRDLREIRQSQAREAFQSKLLASVTNSVVATDVEGRIIYWNAAAALLFGRGEAEVLGKPISDVLVPPERQEWTAGLMRTLRETGSFEGEMQARDAKGRDIPVYATISSIAADDGAAAAYVAVYFDLSELKAEQEARRENERLLSAVLDHLPVAVWIVDRDHRIVRTNPAGHRIWGEEREIAPENYDQYKAWWPETGQRLRAQDWPLNRTLEYGETSFEREIEIESFDGRRKVILDTTIPITSDSGEIIAAVAVNQDVTDRRMAEEALRRSEELFRSLVENLSETVSIIDEDGTMLYQSPAVTRLLGYSQAELIGRNVTEIVNPRDVGTAKEIIEAARASGESQRMFPMEFLHKDGSVRSFEVNTMGIREQGQWHMVATGRDVTERRALEARLQQMDRVSGLGRVAATVAHEINNVLMAIQPFAEIVRRRAGGDVQLERAAMQIGRAMQRGKRVTQEILRFTQPSEPSLQRVNLSAFVEGLRSEGQLLLGPNIDLDIEACDAVFIDVDSDQMAQVVTNLLLNARDAMPEGGAVTIACRVADHVSMGATLPAQPEPRAELAIRDTGRGMSPEVLARVFDPLFTTKRRGTGLGLSVAHQIIQSHRGEIRVSSAEGEGTTFRILLPVAQAAEAVVQTPGDAPQEPAALRRVLIVEDDPTVSLGLMMLLEGEGYSVQVVTTGAEAEAELERFRPDLVLLDYGLPDMTGIDVFRIIRQRRPELPVVFSTGQGEQTAVREALESPGVGYLLKPYDLPQLLEEIRRVTKR